MTFENQVKEAKEKQLESRIIRDIVFIILGVIFLIISILIAYKDKNIEKEKKSSNTTTIVKKESK